MDDCEFCRIAAGEAHASRLYEDDRTVAFLDSDPAIEGHALVVPRAHHEDLLTASESASTAVFHTVRTVADAMERVLAPDGFSVFHTSGVLVGDVTHAHVHLLPRYADDDISLALSRQPPGDDADRVAARLRDALGRYPGGDHS